MICHESNYRKQKRNWGVLHAFCVTNIENEKLEVKGILLRTVRKFKKRLFLK